MSVCVCGCGQRCHRRVAMSVPLLPNPEPIYPLPPWTPINKTGGPNATLERDECRCGRCCQYESDTAE